MNIRERAFYPIDGDGKVTIGEIIDEVSEGGIGEPVTVDTLPGATTVGKSVMKSVTKEEARVAIGAGTSDFSGSFNDLEDKPTIPAAATVDNLGGAGTTGKAVMKAATAEAARTAIGAGTSNLTIGTTASTAKAGNYAPTADEISDATAVGKSVLTATTAAAARAAIGAGTSNLTIGTTAETAKAGNYTPPVVTTSANGLMLAADKVKLNGIAENATANATNAQLRDRSTHTGTQSMSSIEGLQAALAALATSDALSLLEARVAALEGATEE